MHTAAPRDALDRQGAAGIPINYMITVNFRAFKNIVHKLDGVYMDVDRVTSTTTRDRRSGPTRRSTSSPGTGSWTGRRRSTSCASATPTPTCTRRVPAGVREGAEAARLERLGRLPALGSSRPSRRTRGGQGRRQGVSSGEVPGHANAVYGLPAGNFQQVPLDGITGYIELEISDARPQRGPPIHEPRRERLREGDRRGRQAEAQGRDRPPPSQVSIEVLNGSGVAGAADEAAVPTARSAPRPKRRRSAENFDFFRTGVQYDPGPGVEGCRAGGRCLRRGRGAGGTGRRAARRPASSSASTPGDARVRRRPTTRRSETARRWRGHAPIAPALRAHFDARSTSRSWSPPCGKGLVDRRQRGHPRKLDDPTGLSG